MHRQHHTVKDRNNFEKKYIYIYIFTYYYCYLDLISYTEMLTSIKSLTTTVGGKSSCGKIGKEKFLKDTVFPEGKMETDGNRRNRRRDETREINPPPSSASATSESKTPEVDRVKHHIHKKITIITVEKCS